MIGSGIRKFAQQRGLSCGNGFAYGQLHGLHVAMNEGAGWKALHIYLHPPVENSVENAELCARALHTLTDCNLKEYRLHREAAVTAENGFAHLVFFDNPGTMKCIERYVDEILPRLETGVGRCAYCGEPLGDDLRYTQLSDMIMPVHSGCVRELSDQIEIAETEQRSGSVARGAIGALLGAIIGAIPWALVFMLGYVTSLVGLLIGWLANFFYDKFGGKRSPLKVPILIIAVILGLLLGQVAGYTLDFVKIYSDETAAGAQEAVPLADYLQIVWEQYVLYDQESYLALEYDRAVAALPEEERVNLMTVEEFIDTYADPEIDQARQDLLEEFGRNMLLGLFFAALGCVRLVMNTHRANRRQRVRELR